MGASWLFRPGPHRAGPASPPWREGCPLAAMLLPLPDPALLPRCIPKGHVFPSLVHPNSPTCTTVPPGLSVSLLGSNLGLSWSVGCWYTSGLHFLALTNSATLNTHIQVCPGTVGPFFFFFCLFNSEMSGSCGNSLSNLLRDYQTFQSPLLYLLYLYDFKESLTCVCTHFESR